MPTPTCKPTLLVVLSLLLFAGCGEPSTNSNGNGDNQTSHDGEPGDTDTDGDIDSDGDGNWGDGDGDTEYTSGLVIAPHSLDFGTVAVGESETRTFSLQNEGESPLEFTEFALEDDDFLIGSWPETLAPGAVAEVDVTFTPSSTEPKRERVLVRWENAEGEFASSLFVRANLPCLEVSSEFLEFDLDLGTTATQSVTVTNCSSLLEFELLTEIRYRGGATENTFTISNAATLPAVLSPGASSEIEIAYDRQVATQSSAALRLRDSNESVMTDVTLLGRGEAPEYDGEADFEGDYEEDWGSDDGDDG